MKIEDATLEAMFTDLESDRVERKASSKDKIQQAVCAFANDLPDSRLPGVLFIGVNDDGSCANFQITDEVLRELADMLRSDGKILPIPSITVQKKMFSGCEVAVVIVQPSDAPPVRYDGRTWIRIGPRRAIANLDEERRLTEKRRARDLPFDIKTVTSASLSDLDLNYFHQTYLPSAIHPDILRQNERPIEQQLVSLRFAFEEQDILKPTYLGILVSGKDSRQFLPGAYIQFVRFEGKELTDPIKDQKEVSGQLVEVLDALDHVLQAQISIAVDIRRQSTEKRYPDYPIEALRQLVRNSIMHRNYEGTNAPVRIYWFSDRVEIMNPGGLFGQVNRDNFGRGQVTDYRNPHLAEAMKNLGYVQRFGVGIPLAEKALRDNGNPSLEFKIEESNFLAIVRRLN